MTKLRRQTGATRRKRRSHGPMTLPGGRVGQCHIRDNSPDAGTPPKPPTVREDAIARIQRCEATVFDLFDDLIPSRPYCTDDLNLGILIRPRALALQCRHIQLNRPHSFDWVCFDVDRPDAYRCWEDANLPPPTFIVVNPDNGHAHLAYALAAPVHRFWSSRRTPLEWLAAIQRGYTLRLAADRAYNGLLIKNPRHPHWRAQWLAAQPYTLLDLDAALDQNDKASLRRKVEEFGEGRNVAIFNAVRGAMYQGVQRDLNSPEQIFRRTRDRAIAANRQFERPLSDREVNQIARSISRWIAKKFSPETFSEIQRARARRRWAGHEAAEKSKPWVKQGISRSTYYRRKRRQQLR